ncbi:hypothetical protein ACLEYJ_04910 [Escherichia coli]
MATQPTQDAVPSESPRDLKFNAGKIDEFVTSMVNTYIDRFGHEHYTIEGLRWLAQQAIAQYGWIPVGTFQAGATLTLPNQILKDTTDGEYYRWDGALPKVVPVGSTPSTAGGVGVGAWLSVGDSTFRALLASATGSQNIGNGKDTLNNFLYHTPEEFFTGTMDAAFSSSLSASGSDGRRTWIKGDKAVTAAFTVPDNTVVQNDGKTDSSYTGTGTGVPTDFTFNIGNNSVLTGGRINNISKAGVATVRNKTNVKLGGFFSQGSVTAADPFAYAVDIRASNGVSIMQSYLKGYTGAVSMMGTEKTLIDGLHVEDMFYHSGVDAGGYGAVLGGCNDTVITRMLFKARDGDNGRHGVYLALQGGTGNTNTVVSNSIFDYRQKSDAMRGGAINIRSNTRAIINSNIIDGTTLTGIVADGDVIHNIISNNIIKGYKYSTDTTSYGLNTGVNTSGFKSIGSPVLGNVVSLQPKDGAVEVSNMYGITVTGSNKIYANNTIDVPSLAYPFQVSAGSSHILIANNMEYTSTNTGGQAFILFDGVCSDITVVGNKTSRNMFRNITNCTDLTVDFPRTVQISINAGVPTITGDDYSLISGVPTVTASDVTILFNAHVTQAASETALAISTNNFTPPSNPVIAARGSKSITIRFYNNAGSLINPSTTGVAVRLQLSR